jgi:hypothetical protein
MSGGLLAMAAATINSACEEDSSGSGSGWDWDAGQAPAFDSGLPEAWGPDAHISDASIEDANVTDVADADASVTCDPALYEASSARYIAGRCAYFFNTAAVTWPDAEAACLAKGLQLITVGSDQETDELVAWISQHQNATWTGLNDRAAEGSLVWQVADGGAPPAPPYVPNVTGNGDANDCVVLHVIGPVGYIALTCDAHVRMYTCTSP